MTKLVADRPLAGRRVLVTRARDQAGELVELLRVQGAEAVAIPVIRLNPLLPATELRSLQAEIAAGSFDDLVLTSANAVEILLGSIGPAGAAPRIHAVGPGTAAAVSRTGREAEELPEQYIAESLVQRLLDQRMHGRRLLLARAAGAREVLPELLERAGLSLRVVELYQMEPEAESKPPLQDLLTGEGLDWVTFASGSAVRGFAQLTEGCPIPAPIRVACIGPITASAAQEAGYRVAAVAREHTLEGLVGAMAAAVSELPENEADDDLS